MKYSADFLRHFLLLRRAPECTSHCTYCSKEWQVDLVIKAVSDNKLHYKCKWKQWLSTKRLTGRLTNYDHSIQFWAVAQYLHIICTLSGLPRRLRTVRYDNAHRYKFPIRFPFIYTFFTQNLTKTKFILQNNLSAYETSHFGYFFLPFRLMFNFLNRMKNFALQNSRAILGGREECCSTILFTTEWIGLEQRSNPDPWNSSNTLSHFST